MRKSYLTSCARWEPDNSLADIRSIFVKFTKYDQGVSTGQPPGTDDSDSEAWRQIGEEVFRAAG